MLGAKGNQSHYRPGFGRQRRQKGQGSTTNLESSRLQPLKPVDTRALILYVHMTIYVYCTQIRLVRIPSPEEFTARAGESLLEASPPTNLLTTKATDGQKRYPTPAFGTDQINFPSSQEVRKRKWGWIGHTLRKSPDNSTRQVLRAADVCQQVPKRRRVGRPKKTCR